MPENDSASTWVTQMEAYLGTLETDVSTRAPQHGLRFAIEHPETPNWFYPTYEISLQPQLDRLPLEEYIDGLESSKAE